MHDSGTRLSTQNVPAFRDVFLVKAPSTTMEHREPAEVKIGGSAEEEARSNAPSEEEVMALPVCGDAHNAFVTLASHTSSREDDRCLPPSMDKAKEPGDLWRQREGSPLYGVRLPLHPNSAREFQGKGHDDEYTYRCERTQ